MQNVMAEEASLREGASFRHTPDAYEPSLPLLDALSARWQVVPGRSTLTMPMPRAWTVEILSSPDHVAVHQALTRADGSRVSVALDAPCDGRAHRVTGSPVVDRVVYARLDSRSLIGVGEKGDEVTLKVTISASGSGQSLLMDYTTYQHGLPATRGIAVFARID